MNWRALLAEAVGTFFFVTVGAGSMLANEMTDRDIGLVGIALAHGLALAVAVSIFGGISGGHFNPAVSFGLAVARTFPWAQVVPYWAAQLVGGIAGAIVLRVSFADDVARAVRLGTPALGEGVGPGVGVGVEAVLTLFLLLAVLGTAVSPAAPRIAGFGIGLTVAADILMGGPLTGAAMNPARHAGPALVAGFFDDWWVYWIGPLLGGLIGGALWRAAFAPAAEAARLRS